MAFCMKCGNQIPDGMNFCTNCGARVEQPAPAGQYAPVQNPPVQNPPVQNPPVQNPPVAGAPLSQGYQPPTAIPQAPQQYAGAKKRKAAPFILGAVGVLVVGAVAAGFATNWFGLAGAGDAASASGASSGVSSAAAAASSASSASASGDASSGEQAAQGSSSAEAGASSSLSASVSSSEAGGANSARESLKERLGQTASSQSSEMAEQQASSAAEQEPASEQPAEPEQPVEPEKPAEPEQPAGATPPSFANYAASSVSDEDDVDDYRPSSAVDGNVRTAWNTYGSQVGDGTGEWIELSSGDLQHVTGLRIMPGFCKSEETWAKNRRPHDVTVSFSDGSSQSFALSDTFGEYQSLDLNAPVDTTFVRITIDSTYSPTYDGRCYDDCCISEIEVY